MGSVAEEPTITHLLHELDHKLDESGVLDLDNPGPSESEEEITEQIHLVERILSKTRFRLNATRPINQLPFEILASIFLHCQNDAPWSLFPPATREEMKVKGAYSWLAVTGVCVHWRRTALSEPALWSKIYLPSSIQDQTEVRTLFVQRARSFPLRLHQHLRPDKFGFYTLAASLREYQAFATQYAAQLRSFYLTPGGIASTSSQLWKIFEHDFPQLEDLHLDIQSENYASIGNSLHRIFADEQCAMKRLSLSYIPWPTGRANLTHLTHLALRSQTPEQCPSYMEFLGALEGSPLLQFISLHDAGPLAADSGNVAGRIVHLPSLRRIEISWTNGPALWSPRELLSHLEFAEDTEVLLHAQYMFHHDYFSEVLADLPPQKYLDRISTLQLRKSGDTAILIRGESMCIESTVRHDAYLQGFVPLLPNASTLIFDHPILVDVGNISMFYAPSHFSTIRFLHPTNFIPFVRALTDPEGHTNFPFPPSEIYVPATTVEEMSKRYPLYRSKLQQHRNQEVSIVNRNHLKLPPLRVIFEQEGAAPKPPFEGPLRRITRGK